MTTNLLSWIIFTPALMAFGLIFLPNRLEKSFRLWALLSSFISLALAYKLWISFDASYPQILVNIDNFKAAQKGVIVADILSTLQTMLGSEYATNFIRFGQLYRVMVQSSPEYRAKPEDILNLHIKNKDGEMVPISAFVDIEKVYGPETVTRNNLFNAVTINGTLVNCYYINHGKGKIIFHNKLEIPILENYF